jgi:DNA-directed RNA polymerase subunit RPC12/RpoP
LGDIRLIMARCLKCKKEFTPGKNKSTIGCPVCVERLRDEVKGGKWCKCIRCGKEYIAHTGDSLAGCRVCVFSRPDHPIPIENRWEILDL